MEIINFSFIGMQNISSASENIKLSRYTSWFNLFHCFLPKGLIVKVIIESFSCKFSLNKVEIASKFWVGCLLMQISFKKWLSWNHWTIPSAEDLSSGRFLKTFCFNKGFKKMGIFLAIGNSSWLLSWKRKEAEIGTSLFLN